MSHGPSFSTKYKAQGYDAAIHAYFNPAPAEGG